MTLYDEINSSIDKDEVLIELIKMHFSKGGLYYNLTRDKDYDPIQYEEYFDNFDKYIKMSTFEDLYQKLQKYIKSDIDKQLENILENYKKTFSQDPVDEVQKQVDKAKEKYQKYYLYPLSRYSSILNKFKTVKELDDYMLQFTNDKIIKLLRKQKYGDNNVKQEVRRQIKNMTNLPDNQIDEIILIYNFFKDLDDVFYAGEGTMGYHVNSYNLNPAQNNLDELNDDIKFYLNIGVDSYQFADIFRKKCEEQNLKYKFKVVDASCGRGEEKRIDRICIWCSYENAEQFVKILKEIKQEHPEFAYGKPPILCGTIDDFIGVGYDPKDSFNSEMESIIIKAINKIFKDKNLDEILAIISNDPNKLVEFRNEIKNLAKAIGIDPTKMCVSDEAKDKLPISLKTNSDIKYIVLENSLYVNRSTLETARDLQVEIEGKPRVINNKNYYSITPYQLYELDKKVKENYKNKLLKITVVVINDLLYISTDYFDKDGNNKTIINGETYISITEKELFEIQENYKENGIDIIFIKNEIPKKEDKNNELNDMLKSDNTENKGQKHII